MNDYIKYDELKEKIDRFKLTELGIDSNARRNFYNLYDELQKVREIEAANGVLTEAEQGEKKAHMEDIDHWVSDFIQNRKVAIQTDVDTFEQHVKLVIGKFEEVKAMFALNDIKVEEINSVVKGIENDLKELIGEANKLLADIDELKELAKGYTDGLEFTITYTDVKKRINALKDRLKEIKQDQITRYNTQVRTTNEIIRKYREEYANKEGLSDEVLAILAKLDEIKICDVTVSKWNQLWHMTEEYLSYNKLKEMLLLIEQLNVKLRLVTVVVVEEVDLESDIKYIEDKLVEIEGKIKDTMTNDEVKGLLAEVSYVESKITEFEVKLAKNREKISEEKYNDYVNRIIAARKKVEELRKKLVVKVPGLYETLTLECQTLERDVDALSFYVNALFGHVTPEALSVYEERLNVYEGRLNELKEAIENAKLDENQYAELQKRISVIEEKLQKIRGIIKDPKIVAEVEKMDIFAFFNGQIDGVETAINELEKLIDGFGDQKIKDRKVRKEIDKKFSAIEQEIKDIEKFMEKYKDQDPEKYEAAKKRLNELKDKLDKVGKKYRKQCPLLVRVIKSAKNFYKKHKKLCLIIAGLAAIALLHATVGPVIIPAIMHGNLMIGQAAPAISGFTSFVNNILGGIIGAKQTVPGMWYLANGVGINPSVASTSLLKGLAISGLGSATLLAPLTAGVVVAVKKLVNKIKNREKQPKKDKESRVGTVVQNAKDKVKEVPGKLKAGKDKVVQKINNVVKGKNKEKKEQLELVSQFLKEIASKPGMTFDVFCEEHKLTEEQKSQLQEFMAEEKRSFRR